MVKGYYFITDANLSKKGNVSDIKNALCAKVNIIQYRNKESDTKAVYKEASLLRKLCRKALFIINDRKEEYYGSSTT